MKTGTLRQPITTALFVCAMSMHTVCQVPPEAPSFDTSNATDLEHAVMHQVHRYVIFPLDDDEEEMFGTVEVRFAVDTEGQVIVTEAISENQALCDHVLEGLRRAHVEPEFYRPGNTSHLRFVFRPE